MPKARERVPAGSVAELVDGGGTRRTHPVLGLQRSAGNRAVTGLMSRQAPMVQRDALSALGRGYDMYTRLTDEGAPFARELMRWRLIGLGSTFVKRPSDADWNAFMSNRPEIQRAVLAHFAPLVPGYAAAGPTGSFWMGGYRGITGRLTGVLLNELESMRLTLHGSHHIEVGGRYWAGEVDGVPTVRILPRLVWIDAGDLHPGTATELSGGEMVDDREFSAAGFDYDIWIEFEPGESRWEVTAGTARHAAGWPPLSGVPAVGGFRG